MYLLNLLEVGKEISRQNAGSTNKPFSAVDDKVLQEKGTKEGLFNWQEKFERKIIQTETVSSQKIFHQW